MSDRIDQRRRQSPAINNADETLSRSEIESALLGDQANKIKPKKPVERHAILDVPPRRQQVLGGDLSGIASRPKSLGSKLIDVSVVNWLVGIIVLAIVGAFFWPQSQPSVTEVSTEQTTDSERSGQVQEVEVLAEQDTSFSRNDDIDRANDYRLKNAQELQVRNLLAKAQVFVSNNELTEPKNANALNAYRTILTIAPNNADAKLGISNIQEHFQDKALSALDNDDVEAATAALDELNLVETKSDESALVVAAIEEYSLQKKLSELLSKAESARKQDRLILPARDNALYYYQQAIQIDSENRIAKRGIKRVSDAYIQKANDAVLDGSFNRATAHLATVAVIDPQHNSIPLIEAMIARAKPIAEAARAQAEAAAEQTEQQAAAEKEQAEETALAQNTAPTDANQIEETTRTPSTQSREQASFDQRYLENGLDGYYRGEYERAATLLQPLADKGIARAQFRIGYMHYLGRGFTRNRQRADEIIRAALPAIQKFAEEGRAWAQSDLGSLYEDGLVLGRDYGEAVYWYRSAAEQGYPGAQTNLGIMYARGRGVAASRRTAVEWFQRAAKQGDIAARRNLTSMGIN